MNSRVVQTINDSKRLLKSSLADVASRADYIGNHIDGKTH